jgi:hypothetical protein
MARYTDLLIQVSPTVNLYEQFKTPNEEMGSNPLDVLNSMMQPKGTLYLKWLGNLMQLVNTNISQQVMLSGISLANTPVAQILATNKLDPSKVDCRQLDETSFLYCALDRNSDLLHNVLTYSLYNDLRNRTLPSVGYTYVTSLPHSTDAELDAMITALKNSLSSPWPLTKGTLPDGTPWIFTQLANKPVPIPTGQELSQGIIQYRPELKYLLAARENLIDLMTEMRLNEVSDEDVKNQFALKVIKDAL